MEKKIDDFFQNLGGNFTKKKSSWYNGHAYMPLFFYSTFFNYEGWSIEIEYEYRQSEFSKSTATNYTTNYQDRHLCSINGSVISSGNDCSIEIIFFDAFSSLFRKRVAKVKSCRKDFSRSILKLDELIEMSNLVRKSSEFSPLIRGRGNNNKYELTVNFNTGIFPFIHIEKSNLLIKKIIDLINLENEI